jgi:hypothetical protein
VGILAVNQKGTKLVKRTWWSSYQSDSIMEFFLVDACIVLFPFCYEVKPSNTVRYVLASTCARAFKVIRRELLLQGNSSHNIRIWKNILLLIVASSFHQVTNYYVLSVYDETLRKIFFGSASAYTRLNRNFDPSTRKDELLFSQCDE